MNDNDVATRARAVVARLGEAEGKATPGPWRWDVTAAFGAPGEGMVFADCEDEDAAAIVALRNAAPALIRLAEAVGRHFEAIDTMSRLTLVGEGDSLEWDKWSARNREARDDMRAALADLAALGGGADGEVGA